MTTLVANNKQSFYEWLDETYPQFEIEISLEDFKKMLLSPFGHKGAFFISLFTKTFPKMKKSWTGGQVIKHRWLNVVCNCSYKNLVNNARRKEFRRQFQEMDNELLFIGNGILPPVSNGELETFVPHQRKWGQRIKGTPFVEHKGKLYVETFIRSIQMTRYFNGEIELMEAEVTPHLSRKDSVAQIFHQGLPEDKLVVLRDYELKNVHAARFCKRLWNIN